MSTPKPPTVLVTTDIDETQPLLATPSPAYDEETASPDSKTRSWTTKITYIVFWIGGLVLLGFLIKGFLDAGDGKVR